MIKAWDIPWYIHQGLSKETLNQFQGGTKQFQDIENQMWYQTFHSYEL